MMMALSSVYFEVVHPGNDHLAKEEIYSAGHL